MNPITQSMVPSQKHTEKAFVNPQEFSPTDWSFQINRAQRLNWRPENDVQSSDNYFTLNEPHQNIKNQMFDNSTAGISPIYGHTNYFLNPLQQEQTSSHTSAYALQKISRVEGNNNPFSSIMSAPPERYGVNVWVNSYKGSMNRPRYN